MCLILWLSQHQLSGKKQKKKRFLFRVAVCCYVIVWWEESVLVSLSTSTYCIIVVDRRLACLAWRVRWFPSERRIIFISLFFVLNNGEMCDRDRASPQYIWWLFRSHTTCKRLALSVVAYMYSGAAASGTKFTANFPPSTPSPLLLVSSTHFQHQMCVLRCHPLFYT